MAYIKSRKRAVACAASSATAAGVLATLAFGVPAHAQNTPAPATKTATLPEVQVRSDRDGNNDYKADKAGSPKFSQPLVDTTQTVTVIKEKVIQEQAATTLTEALRNVPGVGTFYAGENGNTATGDTVYMRGFDSSSSIFVDGVRDLGSISRDVFNTEQIDVVKGPSGSDFGRGSPTGSINMVTKQPKLEDAFSASFGLGSASYVRGSIDWNKTLTGYPGAALRLNAVGQNAGVAGRDEVKNDRWGIAPSLALGLGTDTRMYFDFLHVKQHNVPDGGVSTVGLPGYSNPDNLAYSARRTFLDSAATVDPSNFYGTSSDKDNVTADMFTFRFERDLNDKTTLRNTFRWGKTKQDYLLSAIMAGGYNAAGVLSGNVLMTPNPADPSGWTIARLINTKDVDNTILTNQTNVSTSFTTGSVTHDLNAGLELIREEQNNHTLATSGTVPNRVNLYNPDSSVSLPEYTRTGAGDKGKTTTAALYAFDTVKVNEQLQFNGGLRVDHYKTNYNTWDATGASTLDLSKSGTLVNWKLGALYKFVPNASVYANYGISQQPPGGSNFALSSSASSASNPNMDPQKAKTAEIGVKWETPDRNLMLSGAVFRTEITNEIVANSDGTYDQVGKKRVQGFELGAVGQITPDWSAMAGYTQQSTKVVTGATVASDGSSSLTYTPKNAFSLWTTYRLLPQLTLGGGATYSGGLRRGTDGAVGTPKFTESYWVFNAMASYRISKNVDVQLNVYNLFDKKYVAAINKSGYRYFPGAPRSARLTVNIAF